MLIVGFCCRLALVAEENAWRPLVLVRIFHPPVRIPAGMVCAPREDVARNEANIGLDRTMNSAAARLDEGKHCLRAVHGRSLRAFALPLMPIVFRKVISHLSYSPRVPCPGEARRLVFVCCRWQLDHLVVRHVHQPLWRAQRAIVVSAWQPVSHGRTTPRSVSSLRSERSRGALDLSFGTQFDESGVLPHHPHGPLFHVILW